MTEIIPFWMAMKYESEGKTVQFEYDHTPNVWTDFTVLSCSNFPTTLIHRCRWRIKPEPVKYSVDMWLDKTPNLNKDCYHLDNYLLGNPISYSKNKSETCNKHYRITVESVGEKEE